jgi:hypothetical protein
MQAFSSSVHRRHCFRVAAIVAWISGSEAGGRMQRLVGVADKMDEPHEIVGLDVVARVRRERCRERFDLRESVYWIGRTHRCSVGRKRKIEIVPIFVAQLIGIADVSRGVVAGRGSPESV